MSFFSALNTSATGLTAQRLRIDVISQNIANVDTTRTEDGTPYKRKSVIFRTEGSSQDFSTYLKSASKDFNTDGVKVSKIVEDQTPGTLVYDPSHPDADETGYVTKPNVNIVEEMVDLISASRSYEANITAVNTTKSLIAKTLEIGR